MGVWNERQCILLVMAALSLAGGTLGFRTKKSWVIPQREHWRVVVDTRGGDSTNAAESTAAAAGAREGVEGFGIGRGVSPPAANVDPGSRPEEAEAEPVAVAKDPSDRVSTGTTRRGS